MAGFTPEQRGGSESLETPNGITIVRRGTVDTMFQELSQGNRWGVRVEETKDYLMGPNQGLGLALSRIMSKYPSSQHVSMMEAAAAIIIALENQNASNRLDQQFNGGIDTEKATIGFTESPKGTPIIGMNLLGRDWAFYGTRYSKVANTVRVRLMLEHDAESIFGMPFDKDESIARRELVLVEQLVNDHNTPDFNKPVGIFVPTERVDDLPHL